MRSFIELIVKKPVAVCMGRYSNFGNSEFIEIARRLFAKYGTSFYKREDDL